MIVKRIPDKDTLGMPSGIWMDEPDFMLWTDEATGYECMIQRAGFTFSLCGYVGVPEDHPLYSLHYSDPIFTEHVSPDGIQVHGGLTYSDKTSRAREVYTGSAQEEGWLFGFDCAHYRDFLPAIDGKLKELRLLSFREKKYRDIDYVKAQVISLAAQLKSADVDVMSIMSKLSKLSEENKT
jgi:hypothetical protein